MSIGIRFLRRTPFFRGMTLIALGAVMVTTASTSRAAVMFTVTDLSIVGETDSIAYGINNSGQVVGYRTVEGSPRAFLWSNGVSTDLGTLGGAGARAYGVNDSGVVVGYAQILNGQRRAFRYSSSVMENLGVLGTGNASEAYAISDSGTVVGMSRSVSTGSGNVRAYRPGSSPSNLGILSGYSASVATAVNADGLIAGYLETSGGVRQAMRYDGAMTGLGTLGGASSAAHGINDNGVIVGEAQLSDAQFNGFVYQGGVMTALGTLGGSSSVARDVNNQGQIVGMSKNDEESNRAFLFQNDEMVDLNDLIDPLLGWQLIYAYGINEGGQIVGLGQVGDFLRGFLLTPIPLDEEDPEDNDPGQDNLAAPEPATCWIAAFGTLGLVYRGLRRRYSGGKPRSCSQV